jgi:predicted Zn finger-like uncharacterized protein
MPLTVTCPGCATTLKVRDELAGRTVKCPKCAGLLEIPSAQSGDGTPAAGNRRERDDEAVEDADRPRPPRVEMFRVRLETLWERVSSQRRGRFC